MRRRGNTALSLAERLKEQIPAAAYMKKKDQTGPFPRQKQENSPPGLSNTMADKARRLRRKDETITM